MNKFAPLFLKKLDTWLLLNYPRIWATQSHYFLWILLCGTLISAVVAFFPSIRTESLQYFFAYQSNSILKYSIQGILAFILTIFWLTQFRAKFRVFNYKEALLSLLLLTGITLSVFFFCATYSIVLDKRKANLIDKKEVEKDVVLAHLISKVSSQENTILRTVEDVKVQDYTFSKKEIETIFLQKKYFTILENTELGGYIAPNDSIYSGLNDEQLNAKSNEMNEKYKVFHFKAVENCQTVPDSIKKMYFALSKDRTETPSFYNWFLQVHLAKISPTFAMLAQKYFIKTMYLEYNNVSDNPLSNTIQSYFALQNASWLGRLLERNYFSFTEKLENLEGNKSISLSNTVAALDITQSQVNNFQEDLENFKEKNKDWNNTKLLCILLFFPFMLLCGIVHFGIRDVLIGLLGFIIGYLLNLLLFAMFDFRIYHVTPILIQVLFVQALVFYFYWQKNVKSRRFAQLLLPFSIFTAIIGLIVFVNAIDNYWLKEYEPTNIYIVTFLAYTLLVFPFTLALYHRLEFLPKQK